MPNATVIEESVTEQYARELGEARSLLATALAERGADYTYEMPDGADDCMYLTYGSFSSEYDDYPILDTTCPTGASCLVGHVLVTKGIDMLEIAQHEGTVAGTMLPKLGAFNHPVVVYALGEAQGAQDRGETWGEAVARFEHVISKYEAFIEGSDNHELGADIDPLQYLTYAG